MINQNQCSDEERNHRIGDFDSSSSYFKYAHQIPELEMGCVRRNDPIGRHHSQQTSINSNRKHSQSPTWTKALAELEPYPQQFMSLPLLRDIVVKNAEPEANTLLPLLTLIRRNHPPLTSMSLIQSALVAPTIISVLEENPRLETLCIYIRRGDVAAVDTLIDCLTYDHHHHVACFAPNLATLEVIGRGAFNE
ncbi:hypothetical protein B0H17DRAFT_1144363 [Mycena rosella]|uniref:Uncharacterized protein n=1 Tax=Mycena rosella TaxID=1033263 RepID=A0AAD7G2Z1_MYCRO|nr:hypothetical protein B0H17DRAFT_1144363 [Mycena rosella]